MLYANMLMLNVYIISHIYYIVLLNLNVIHMWGLLLQCLKNINCGHILEPWCPRMFSGHPTGLRWYTRCDLMLEDNSIDFLLSSVSQFPKQLQWCRVSNLLLSISCTVWYIFTLKELLDCLPC